MYSWNEFSGHHLQLTLPFRSELARILYNNGGIHSKDKFPGTPRYKEETGDGQSTDKAGVVLPTVSVNAVVPITERQSDHTHLIMTERGYPAVTLDCFTPLLSPPPIRMKVMPV